MPILSMFYGIIIRMNLERDEKHNKPHIHAEYQGSEVSVSLDGEVLAGAIPPKKLRMVLTWIDIHEEELKADWDMLIKYGEYVKIKPLD